jgi:4-hydroxybenzoyl-CoA reductase subunit beta
MGTLGGNVLLDTRCLYYNQPEGWRDSLGGCLKCVGDTCHVAPKGKGCYAAHSADTVPVLLLLGARLRVVDATGERTVPLDSLYGDDGLRPHALPPGTLLLRVELPRFAGHLVHRKLRLRQAIDYAQLLTAVSHSERGWEAVVSAVGPQPVRVSAASAEQLPEAAFRAVQPLATHAAAATWRKKMIRVEVRRAIDALHDLESRPA